MSDTLLIHYNIEHTQQATWALCNSEGELTGKISSGSLAELSEAAAEHTTVVLLNSHCLHINQLQLPTQNLQKLLKAVPYAIEEFIADDVENFHFVVARNKHNSSTSVVGIDKAILKKIIQVFHSANINIEKIIPDALCLAANDGEQWACLNYKNDSYLQTDVKNGLIVSHDILPYIVTSKLHDENQNKPERILLFSEQDDTTSFDQLRAEKINDAGDIELVNIVYNTHPLVVFCGNYKQAMPLNLLQHDFKPRSKTSGYWQHWRLAASLAAIWLVLHLGLTIFQYSQLKDDNIITRAKIEKIYKKSFPQSRKIVNPRVQMEQKLKELKGTAGGGNEGLIFLLAESFGTLTHEKDKITLQSLTFRNNRMDIGLEGSNLQAVENLNNNLNNNKKIKSEITSSSSEKDKVKGNLRIEARG
jgi:general secretion pathway protein L